MMKKHCALYAAPESNTLWLFCFLINHKSDKDLKVKVNAYAI